MPDPRFISVKVYRPADVNYAYLVDFTIKEGSTLEPLNWFGFANQAELEHGRGWVTKQISLDTRAKKEPGVVNWGDAPEWLGNIPSHQGHYWVYVEEYGKDYKVKIKLGEPLPAGRYMSRVMTRKSKE